MECSFITLFTDVGCDLCWKSWTLAITCVELLIRLEKTEGASTKGTYTQTDVMLGAGERRKAQQ